MKNIFQNEMALVFAWISTLQRAGVITTLLGPRALLQAFDRLMDEVGVTWAVTGMPHAQVGLARNGCARQTAVKQKVVQLICTKVAIKEPKRFLVALKVAFHGISVRP